MARLLLVLILIVAAALRVVGTRFGFPLLLHPDEWAVVDAVVDMAKRHSFEPPWSLRPDHVEMKVDYLLFAAYATVMHHGPIAVSFANDPVPFYWIARLATAAFGVASVWLAYLIGCRTSRRLGLVMAGLFAIFPAFVLHAHYATPDVPLTFALLLLIYALMRYTAAPARASLLLACFAVALGIAIKYPAAVGAVMIGVVVVACAVRDRAWFRVVSHGALSIVAVLGFLFLISPVLFTNFSGIRQELKVQAAGDRLGHPDYGFVGNMRYYADVFADYSGIVLIALALLGAFVVIRRRNLEYLPWAVGLVVWASLSTLPMTWERWGLPMWPTPLLLGSVGMTYLMERLTSRRTRWVPVAVGAWVVAHLAMSSTMVEASLVADDSRAAALGYVRSHGIDPANSIYEGYTPFLPGDSALFFKQVAHTGETYRFRTAKGTPATYAVLSSGMYTRVFADKTETANQAIYQWIFDHGQLVAEFSPVATPQPSVLEPVDFVRDARFVTDTLRGGKSGPRILIYKLPGVSR